jgi:hypothetical protein
MSVTNPPNDAQPGFVVLGNRGIVRSGRTGSAPKSVATTASPRIVRAARTGSAALSVTNPANPRQSGFVVLGVPKPSALRGREVAMEAAR